MLSSELGWLMPFLTALWADWRVQFMVYHIGANLLVALATAIYVGDFKLDKVAEVLYKKLLPYCLIYGAAMLLVQAAPAYGEQLLTVVWGLIETTLLSDLLENLAKVGIKLDIVTAVPQWIKK